MSLAPLDRGCRFVRATGCRSYDDDPALPFKLYVNLRPPEMMLVTFVMLHGGSEEIVVRGESLAAIEEFLKSNELESHPRFRRLIIDGPDGLHIEREWKR